MCTFERWHPYRDKLLITAADVRLAIFPYFLIFLVPPIRKCYSLNTSLFDGTVVE